MASSARRACDIGNGMRCTQRVRWWPKFLWSDCYRGVEIGRVWIGWTNPIYKKRGW